MSNDQTHAAILRAKVAEMFDAGNNGHLSIRQFQVQVLNALYVVADALDRIDQQRGKPLHEYQGTLYGVPVWLDGEERVGAVRTDRPLADAKPPTRSDTA